MANRTEQPDGLGFFKLEGYREQTLELDAGEDNVFNGVLMERDLTSGKAKNWDPTSGNPFIGIALFNRSAAGVAPGEDVRIVRGIALSGLALAVGTAGVGDPGRPVYGGADNQTIADYTNAPANKTLVGKLAKAQDGSAAYDWLEVPANLDEGADGLRQISLSDAAVTGTKTIATGLGEVVEIIDARVAHGTAPADGFVVLATPSGTAGSVDVEVYDHAGVASVAAVTVELVVKGNLRAVLS